MVVDMIRWEGDPALAPLGRLDTDVEHQTGCTQLEIVAQAEVGTVLAWKHVHLKQTQGLLRKNQQSYTVRTKSGDPSALSLQI